MNKQTGWIIGLGIVAAVAAAIVYTRKKDEYKGEKPPKGAPQLNLDNPGSQAEFPSAAGESEIG